MFVNNFCTLGLVPQLQNNLNYMLISKYHNLVQNDASTSVFMGDPISVFFPAFSLLPSFLTMELFHSFSFMFHEISFWLKVAPGGKLLQSVDKTNCFSVPHLLIRSCLVHIFDVTPFRNHDRCWRLTMILLPFPALLFSCWYKTLEAYYCFCVTWHHNSKEI